MDEMIETIVSKLRRLSIDKLQVILEFVNFIDWQERRPVVSNSPVSADAFQKMTESDRQTEWIAFINECSGAFPNFQTIEGIRADMSENAAREQF